MANLQATILQKLVHDETYCRKVLPFIKLEYFEPEYKVVYKLILDFIGKYNKLPNETTLGIDLDHSDVSEEIYPAVERVLDEVKANPVVEESWLLTNTEKWCKDRAIFLAVMKSYEIIGGNDRDLGPGAIPDIFQKALGITFDDSVGHDYLTDWEKRYDFYHRKEERIPFDLEMFNKITKGGIPKKTLNIILAGVGVGKSLTMCHLASSYLLQGKNVLYITMEMAEERIAERIDANLMNIDLNEIENISKNMFGDKIAKIAAKTVGKLEIKEYPTATAHSGHFRALLQELKLKKNFVADVIFVDYLNICACSRLKCLSGSINTYSLVKAIAEELRGLAVEFNVPIWSATQLTRSGFSDSDPGMDDTAESFGLPATADFMVALVTTDELEKLGQLMVKQLKNRYADLNVFKRFVIGVSKAKMKLFDVENKAQTLISDNVSSPAARSSPATPSFQDFKVE